MSTNQSGLAVLALAGVMLALAPHQSLAQKRQRDRITRAEIEGSAHKDLDLFQVVRGLRPNFLEPPKGVRSLRGNSNQAPIAVFVDGRRDTGIDALRLIDPSTVEEVRYMEPTQSATEYGPNFNGGALLIKLIRKMPNDTMLKPPKDSLAEPE